VEDLHMPTRAVASFEVVSREQSTYDEPVDAPALARAKVKKVFRGEVEAESTAELLTCRPDETSGGYVGSERIVGRIGDRAGSFVVQHGATQDGDTYGVGCPVALSGHPEERRISLVSVAFCPSYTGLEVPC
jgi:hypothetical protein